MKQIKQYVESICDYISDKNELTDFILWVADSKPPNQHIIWDVWNVEYHLLGFDSPENRLKDLKLEIEKERS